MTEEIKPEMIEEATKQAREVAQKFAADSQSTLGKIKRASQGQFSIKDRDKNNPHIKKIRVVLMAAIKSGNFSKNLNYLLRGGDFR
jgi:hypothetical protein